jgi:hypothetical protein
LEVLEQNNFSNQKQAELLQILNFALYRKNYPQDICGILERKIQILQQPDTASTTEKENADVASIKVRSIVILELLKKLQLGTAHNDLTKICRLIAFLTGNSYNSIHNELQKGVFFSNYHKKEIDEANKILAELNILISIDKDKQY